MRVLVVGGGGREHALAWKIASDAAVERVFVAPGSAGIAAIAECVALRADDIEGLANFALEAGIDLTVVGPEAPLAAGLADHFHARGLRVFGPGRDGARLEASKAFMKEVLVSAGVPTAAYREFSDAAPARAWARELGFPLVVKADGLAAGKGVIICADELEADQAIAAMLEQRRFGEAGRSVVIEEFLRGEEASFIALADGSDVVVMAPSQDHKAVFDHDRGPNTGGMGAYSPAPVVTEAIYAEVLESILKPTLAELRHRGIDYRGVLYAGLMIDQGKAKVLEYNVRFGDPEAQPLMMRLRSSLVELIEACIDGDVGRLAPLWSGESAACVVLSSGGYPGEYRKGEVISGIDEAAAMEGVELFHSGSSRDDAGRWLTAGGRVLGVTGSGADIATAVERAYAAVSKISWPGMHYRRDIARRAIERHSAG